MRFEDFLREIIWDEPKISWIGQTFDYTFEKWEIFRNIMWFFSDHKFQHSIWTIFAKFLWIQTIPPGIVLFKAYLLLDGVYLVVIALFLFLPMCGGVLCCAVNDKRCCEGQIREISWFVVRGVGRGLSRTPLTTLYNFFFCELANVVPVGNNTIECSLSLVYCWIC